MHRSFVDIPVFWCQSWSLMLRLGSEYTDQGHSTKIQMMSSPYCSTVPGILQHQIDALRKVCTAPISYTQYDCHIVNYTSTLKPYFYTWIDRTANPGLTAAFSNFFFLISCIWKISRFGEIFLNSSPILNTWHYTCCLCIKSKLFMSTDF